MALQLFVAGRIKQLPVDDDVIGGLASWKVVVDVSSGKAFPALTFSIRGPDVSRRTYCYTHLQNLGPLLLRSGEDVEHLLSQLQR